MPRTIMTHVGISALTCAALQRHATFDIATLRTELADGFAQDADFDLFVRDLERGLRDSWSPRNPYTAAQRRKESPAEVASLSKLAITPTDRVVLLHSDTAGGRFCALAVAAILQSPEIPTEQGFPRCTMNTAADVIQIQGLSVTDEGTVDLDHRQSEHAGGNNVPLFVQQGLKSYVVSVCELYQDLVDRGGGELIFNITSGYKGLIPMSRDLSLLLYHHSRKTGTHISSDICYLYADSSQLIRYGGMPVQPEWGEIPEKLLAAADTPDGVDAENVLPHHRALFMEKPGRPDRLQRSALGEVVWTLYQRIDYGTIL